MHVCRMQGSLSTHQSVLPADNSTRSQHARKSHRRTTTNQQVLLLLLPPPVGQQAAAAAAAALSPASLTHMLQCVLGACMRPHQCRNQRAHPSQQPLWLKRVAHALKCKQRHAAARHALGVLAAAKELVHDAQRSVQRAVRCPATWVVGVSANARTGRATTLRRGRARMQSGGRLALLDGRRRAGQDTAPTARTCGASSAAQWRPGATHRPTPTDGTTACPDTEPTPAAGRSPACLAELARMGKQPCRMHATHLVKPHHREIVEHSGIVRAAVVVAQDEPEQAAVVDVGVLVALNRDLYVCTHTCT